MKAKARIIPLFSASAEFKKQAEDGTASKMQYKISTTKTAGGYWFYSGNEDELVAKIIDIFDDSGNPVDVDSFIESYMPSQYCIKFDCESSDGAMHFDLQKQKSAGLCGTEENFRNLSLQVMEKKIADGTIEREDATRIFNYLSEDCRVSWKIILFTALSWKKHRKAIDRPMGLFVDHTVTGTDVQDGIIAKALWRSLCGYAVLLEAPKSSGKDVLCKTIAYCKHQNAYTITMGDNVDLSVVHGICLTDNSAARFLNSAEALRTELKSLQGDMESRARMSLAKAKACSTQVTIIKSQVHEAIEDEGLLQIDEINCGNPNDLESWLNPLLDGHAEINSPGIGIMKAKGVFSVFATQNAQYIGTHELNEAMLSRFKKIVIDYPKNIEPVIRRSAETELKKKLAFFQEQTDGIDLDLSEITIPKEFLKEASAFYRSVFCAFRNGSISDTALNIRGFASAITSVVIRNDQACKLQDALLTDVVSHCSDPAEYAAVVGLLHDTVVH